MTIVATGTIETLTAKNRGTATLLQVTGAWVGDAARGMIVVNATRANSRAAVHQISVGTVTLCQPISAPSLPSTFYLPEPDDTWAPGDSVSIYSYPVLNLKQFYPSIGDNAPGTIAAVAYVQNLHILDTSDDNRSFWAVDTSKAYYVQIVECLIDTEFDIKNAYAINCVGNGDVSMDSGFSIILGGSYPFVLALAGEMHTDLDAIVQGIEINGGDLIVGTTYVSGELYTAGAGQADLIRTFSGDCALWGPGEVSITGPGALTNANGTTWAETLLVTGALKLGTSTTGTSYASGVFTDGVDIDPTNLDAHVGLQNPVTGARFAITNLG